MRRIAILGVFGLVAALVSGCALDGGESAPTRDLEPTAEERAAFDASLFKFGLQVPDDHQGKAGGWQVSSTVLKFVDTRESWINPAKWDCRVTIGMPVRSEFAGFISPERAADMSAAAAVAASTKVMNERPRWVVAFFCSRFAAQIMRELNSLRIGARVTSP